MFCKSCEPICEPEITPVLYHLENLQKSKQKQFPVQCSVHKSYKTWKWTSSCIGNFEENMDLSRIYLAVSAAMMSWVQVWVDLFTNNPEFFFYLQKSFFSHPLFLFGPFSFNRLMCHIILAISRKHDYVQAYP